MRLPRRHLDEPRLKLSVSQAAWDTRCTWRACHVQREHAGYRGHWRSLRVIAMDSNKRGIKRVGGNSTKVEDKRDR